MSLSHLLFAAVGVAIFSIGFAATLLSTNVLRKVMALNVMGSGAFLIFISLGARSGSVDPTSQAMVLTGIVVAVASSALGLALAARLQALSKAQQSAASDHHG